MGNKKGMGGEMSNTLDKEELLEWLDRFVFSNKGFSVNRECVEGHEHCQAYQQIVALIKSGNE